MWFVAKKFFKMRSVPTFVPSWPKLVFVHAANEAGPVRLCLARHATNGPPDPRTEEATMREALLCAREGITINIFLLSSWNQTEDDIRFARRLAETPHRRFVAALEDRAGNVLSSLTIQSDPGNPLDVLSQQHEGITMDANGYIYVVNENGGGDINHPQIWVYAPASAPNQAPTVVNLINPVTSMLENTSTSADVKVADLALTDDGIGTNVYSLSGADAAHFRVDSTGLYIKAGTVLDFETKPTFNVTVNVDDTSVGATPDASTNYALNLVNVLNEGNGPMLYISEVAPWSSGNSAVAADWFELTNSGTSAVDITGWKMDDNSNSFASSVALNGITSIAAGESVIFIEGGAAQVTAFVNTWFGGVLPAGLQIGTYTGSGIGLSTSGATTGNAFASFRNTSFIVTAFSEQMFKNRYVLREKLFFESTPGSERNHAIGFQLAFGVRF